MTAKFDESEDVAILTWVEADPSDAVQLDHHRVTEDAAEAVSLALVSVAHGWTIRRRLARGEAADWLLRDASGRLIALEVSGIDRGAMARRIHVKLEQAARAIAAPHCYASVVELATPRAALASVGQD